MKLGFVSSILDGWTFEEMINIAEEMGFSSVEVACWPVGKAERRYAGVSHIDVERVLEDNTYTNYVLEYCKRKKLHISALAYYPNTMDGDLDRRKTNICHLNNVIRASAKLNVNMVTTFIGRNQYKTVEENFQEVGNVWLPIISLAEELGVKIGIENCPMLFGPEQWPGGQNLMTSPANWTKIFELLSSPYLGINYDPSHCVWQMIDYIKPLYTFKDKIFHVHFKDIKLYPDKLEQVGIMAYPLQFMSPKLPGLGDVDWGRFVSALTDIGYDGSACIEVEDRAFEASREKVIDSLRLSKHYMENYVI